MWRCRGSIVTLARSSPDVITLSPQQIERSLAQLADELSSLLQLDAARRSSVCMWMPRSLEAALLLLLATTSSTAPRRACGRIDLVVLPERQLVKPPSSVCCVLTTSDMISLYPETFTALCKQLTTPALLQCDVSSPDLSWRCKVLRNGVDVDVNVTTDADAWGVMFTSGTSTKLPSGVWLRRSALHRRCSWAPFKGRCVAWNTSPTFVDALWQVLGTLLSDGGRLAILPLPPAQASLPRADDLWRLFARLGVSTYCAVPSVLRWFVHSLSPSAAATSLRSIIASGEVLDTRLALALRHRFPHAELYNLYGCTEAAGDSTAFNVSAFSKVPSAWPLPDGEQLSSYCGWNGAIVPIGFPIAGSRVFLAPHGESAHEIVLAGPQVALGYLKTTTTDDDDDVSRRFANFDSLPSASVEVGIKVAAAASMRVFHTHDIGWVDTVHGWLLTSGRASRVIKHRSGTFASLDAVERRVRAHARVSAAAVVQCKVCSELAIAVVAAAAIESDLRRWVASNSACVTPRHWLFVECLPQTASEKLDYLALQEMLDCTDTDTDTAAGVGRELELNGLEQKIVAAFQKLLLPPSSSSSLSIDVDSDFVALGGDSLLAAYVAELCALPHAAAIIEHRTPRLIAASARSYTPSAKRRRIAAELALVEDMAPHLACKWRIDFGKCIDADPALVRIDAADCVIASSHSGLVQSVIVSSGAVMWRQQLPTRLEARAVTLPSASLLVLVGRNGCVYWLCLRSGRVLRRHPLTHRSAPLVSAPILLPSGGGDGSSLRTIVASYDGKLYVFSTPPMLSEPPTVYDVGAPVRADLVAVNDEYVLALTLHGVLQVWELDAMKRLCEFDLEEPTFVAPTVMSSSSSSLFTCVCCTVKGGVVGLGVSRDGPSCLLLRPVWRLQCGGPLFAPPSVLAPGLLVLPAVVSSTDGTSCWHMLVLDAASGARLAAQPLPAMRRIATAIGVEPASSLLAVVSVCGLVQVWKWQQSTKTTFSLSLCCSRRLGGEVYSTPLWSHTPDPPSALVLVCGCRDDHLHAMTLPPTAAARATADVYPSAHQARADVEPRPRSALLQGAVSQSSADATATTADISR